MTNRHDLRAAAPSSLDELWLSYKATGDERLCDQLILHYAPLVPYVAGRVRVGAPDLAARADLTSAGMRGLIDAIDRFSPDRDARFETYAITRIRGAMLDELRALPGRPSPADGEGREGPCHEDTSQDAAAEDHESRRLLAPAVDALPEREKTVVTLYFYEGLTDAEIGAVLGLPDSRVHRIRAAALARLRTALAEDSADLPDGPVQHLLRATERALSRTESPAHVEESLAALWERIGSEGPARAADPGTE